MGLDNNSSESDCIYSSWSWRHLQGNTRSPDKLGENMATKEEKNPEEMEFDTYRKYTILNNILLKSEPLRSRHFPQF